MKKSPKKTTEAVLKSTAKAKVLPKVRPKAERQARASRQISSKTSHGQHSSEMDSPPRRLTRRRTAIPAAERALREALSLQLHDLLNALWPAAARIEVSISCNTYPRTFLKTLAELGLCVNEAMTIASEASALVDMPPSPRPSS